MPNRSPLTKTAPAWSQDRTPRGPLYRVVEIVRDETGRLRKDGRIWHPDLDVTRKFGRAVASNSAGHRVQIANAAGETLESLEPPGLDHCAPRWEGWKDIPLPPCPPKVPRRRAPAPAMTFDPTPDPFGLGDPFDELKNALVAAGEAVVGPQGSVEDPPGEG